MRLTPAVPALIALAVVAGCASDRAASLTSPPAAAESARSAVVAPDQASADGTLAAGLEQAIDAAFGLQVAVIVLDRAELARVIADNPYPTEPDPRLVHVVFFSEEPGRPVLDRIAEAQRTVAAKHSRDEATVIGRAMYVHTPDGYGRSELAARLGKVGSGAAAGTARNWATVTKLLTLCDAG